MSGVALSPGTDRAVRRLTETSVALWRHRIVPAARRVRRLESWVTSAGWVAAGGVGTAVVGLALGWTEFVVIGATCALALLTAVLWVIRTNELSVRFSLERHRVVAGDTAAGSIELRNRDRRGRVPTRIELVIGRGAARFTLPPLARDDVHEQLFHIPTTRRGVIRIGPVRSVRSDPLQLLRRVQVWSESVDLHVHPRTVDLSSDSTGFIRDIEGVTSRELSSNDVSFHALREYQPGDDRRAIHWKTTARVGKLMVRQFEETRRAHLLVVLPTGEDDYASPEDFETAISFAGSLARYAYADEREVSLYTTGGLIECSTAPLILDRLAELEPSRHPLSLRDLTARAATSVPRASVAAIIADSATAPAEMRAARRCLPGSVMSFGLRVAPGRALARRRVADLSVIDVPDLESLPAAVRSVR